MIFMLSTSAEIQLELAPAQENTEENRQGNEKKQTE